MRSDRDPPKGSAMGWKPICVAVALVSCSSASGDPASDQGAGGDESAGTGGTPSSGASGGSSNIGGAHSSGSAGASAAGGSSAGGSTGGSGGSSAGGASGSSGTDAGPIGSVDAGKVPPRPCTALPAAGKWESISPPGATDTQSLVLDPFDGQTVWLGTSPRGKTPGKGGLYKSTDCGSTWTHVNTGANGAKLDTSSMWSMAVDPVTAGVVYMIGMYGPGGLWKSTNGGTDFTQLLPSTSEFATIVPGSAVGSISMDPHDHLHLVVGTHNNCTGAYAPACGAESTDGGATWTFFTTPFLKGWAEQTGPYVLDAKTWLYATVFDGFWLTTDRGASWQEIKPGPGVIGANGGEYTVRPFVPGADGIYYLPLAQQGGANGGLLKSTDGKSWSVIANSPKGNYDLGFVRGDGHLYMADRGGQTYYVASETDAATWTKLPNPDELATQTGQGGVYLDYDAGHHILYSSNFEGGAYRLVTR